MAIGITIWQERVAPTFDSADEIVIIQTAEDVLHPVLFPGGTVMERIRWLTAQGVDEILCGAISRCVEELLIQSGIRVHGFLSGEVSAIQRARFSGALQKACFCMPGCRGRACRCRDRFGSHGGKK